ncbi:hypothetical protein HPB47_005602 [Ixodes persulcatus]|uniref:Uncharacterized protein n=1 Tax=Ixodes persulcatus TaxID=34615 RepID=A0AC60PDH9_IXOPE|nr:hypothetical protein HPB47_005602 [Ixodes persulcatus]
MAERKVANTDFEDRAKRDLWEKNLQRSDKRLEETSAVCELHFEPRFILRDYVHIIDGKEQDLNLNDGDDSDEADETPKPRKGGRSRKPRNDENGVVKSKGCDRWAGLEATTFETLEEAQAS